MSIDLEYAIKQDVRNNPVVREVDRAQWREFARTLGWVMLGIAMLIFALWPRTSLLSRNYDIEGLRRQLDEEKALHRKYVLQLETDLRPDWLHRRAVTELSMIEPREGDTVVLQVVPAPAPASSAIVAAVR
jgi:hypothetical protein